MPADGTSSALTGEVTPDVDAADLLALGSGIASGAAAGEQLDRLLRLVRRGAERG